MKDASLFSIEEPQQNKVAIEKINEGPRVQWQAKIEAFEPEYPLVRTTKKRGFDFPWRASSPAFSLLTCEDFRVAQMLLKVEEYRIFLEILLDDRRLQFTERAVHVNTRI